MKLTAAQLAAAMGIPLVRAQKWIEPINQALVFADITIKRSAASFLAQIGHESLSLTCVKEMGGPKYFAKYDTGSLALRLGNTPEADGDGQKYPGRGLIQVTGTENYRVCSQALFGDDRLLDKPEILEEPLYAALSAAWFWKTRKLNSLSADFEAQTRKINGGFNGLPDRLKRLELAMGNL